MELKIRSGRVGQAILPAAAFSGGSVTGELRCTWQEPPEKAAAAMIGFYEKALCVKQKILVFLPPEIQSLPFRRSQFVWAWRIGLSRARRFCAAERTLDNPTRQALPTI